MLLICETASRPTIKYGYNKCGIRARVFSQTLKHGNNKNEIRQRNRRRQEERREFGNTKSGPKKKKSDGPSLPKQNIIIINIIL